MIKHYTEIPVTPPPRLTIKEVMEISCLSRSTIAARQESGKFPKPLYRSGQGNVYNGEAVYRALGFVLEDVDCDPFYETA